MQEVQEIDIHTSGISLPSGSFVLRMVVPAVPELILNAIEVSMHSLRESKRGRGAELINLKERLLDRNSL
jgi:hypothetical protein